MRLQLYPLIGTVTPQAPLPPEVGVCAAFSRGLVQGQGQGLEAQSEEDTALT